MEKSKKPQHVQINQNLGTEVTKDSEGNDIIIQHLKPFDKLVYAMMKKNMDAETNQTFVSIETIAEELNVSRNKIMRSIVKLCDCGVIKKLTQKIGRSNKYEFVKFLEGFEMFTNEFLDDMKTLSTDEKAIVVALQEHTYKDSETGDAFTTHSLESLARAINISTPTLRKTFNSLEAKGIMQSTLSRKIDTTSGTHMVLRRIDNEKIAQAVLFIGKQVVENTNDIAELKQIIQEMRLEQKKTNEEIRNLKVENDILKKRLNKNSDLPKEFDFYGTK